MRRPLFALIMLLLGAGAVAAQDCGQGLPCGPVPWKLPALPTLQSPTPMPTFAVTYQATDVSGAVPTPAAIPTNPPLNNVDTSGIADNLATLQAIVEQTPEPIFNPEGTEISPMAQLTEGAAGAGQIFGIARALQNVYLGSWTPLIALGFTTAGVVLSVKLMTILLPFLASAFGILRKIVQLVLDFLPF